MLNRRRFAAGLITAGAVSAGRAKAQAGSGLKQLSSGVFKPGPVKNGQEGHSSQQFLTGMLSAGNIRLEMHESVQQPGAPHEAVGTHKHSEIWCMKKGVASLYINGTEHRMEAGDVGLVCAGDEHWIKNAGDTELAYFVITVGPPE
jgi:mannose-6-phosphate isomerase-like protein (cupin superfamily)